MSDATSQFADLLLAARKDMTGGRIATLPDALKPADMAAALAVQHKVAKSFAIGGWKVGAPGGTKMCGALPAATIQPSPAKLAPAEHPLRIVESEVAFRMKYDLPRRAAPYTKAEVAAADLFLLLFTSSWFASKYIRETEFPAIQARVQAWAWRSRTR